MSMFVVTSPTFLAQHHQRRGNFFAPLREN